MKLFCGGGVITADGEAWEHSRGMMKGLFRRDDIVNLHVVDRAVGDLFTHIPDDGGTVDLQPLFYNIVSIPLRYLWELGNLKADESTVLAHCNTFPAWV